MDNQRRKSIYKDSGQVVHTKHYFGDYEKINENSIVKNYHYISSPTGLCAIFVTDDQGGQGQLWHTYSDHLGSLVYMVDADNSNDYKEYSYDAWGNPRDAGDWTQAATETLFAGRGFTGHEHLEEFALINMNGRIYDPMLGRFFSLI
jgi:RHS repeat-associated protein